MYQYLALDKQATIWCISDFVGVSHEVGMTRHNQHEASQVEVERNPM